LDKLDRASAQEAHHAGLQNACRTAQGSALWERALRHLARQAAQLAIADLRRMGSAPVLLHLAAVQAETETGFNR